MAALCFSIFIVHILSTSSLEFVYPDLWVKLFVYPDKAGTLDEMQLAYWYYDVIDAAFDRPTGCESYTECVNNRGTKTEYTQLALVPKVGGSYGEADWLAAVIDIRMYWDYDATADYNETKVLFNNFNPNDIQTYLAEYIRRDVEFQVLDVSYGPDYYGDSPIYTSNGGTTDSITGTAGNSSYTEAEWTCLTESACGPAVFLRMECEASAPFDIYDDWDDPDSNEDDDEWDWEIIWTTYMFPNHGNMAYRALHTYISSEDTTIGSKVYFGYMSYDDFEEDLEHNNNDMSVDGVVDSFYNNVPMDLMNVTFTCDSVYVLCAGKDYCGFTLKWQDLCDYDNCDSGSDDGSDDGIDGASTHRIAFLIGFIWSLWVVL